jgi:hypothetical protein
MKKVLQYLLVLVFAYQSTSNLWIMASFYAQQEFIANNLCINRFESIPICKGQCYLDLKLEENEKKEQQLPELKIKEVQLFFQFQQSIAFIPIISKTQEPSQNQQKIICTDFKFAVFHPPRLV